MKLLDRLFRKKAKTFKKSEWVTWKEFTGFGNLKDKLNFQQNSRKSFLPKRSEK